MNFSRPTSTPCSARHPRLSEADSASKYAPLALASSGVRSTSERLRGLAADSIASVSSTVGSRSTNCTGMEEIPPLPPPGNGVPCRNCDTMSGTRRVTS